GHPVPPSAADLQQGGPAEPGDLQADAAAVPARRLASLEQARRLQACDPLAHHRPADLLDGGELGDADAGTTVHFVEGQSVGAGDAGGGAMGPQFAAQPEDQPLQRLTELAHSLIAGHPPRLIVRLENNAVGRPALSNGALLWVSPVRASSRARPT